ncbi:MAG: hypothetical protein MJ252_04910 [archaeon]|nr:hypothetical protein [archaeon]
MEEEEEHKDNSGRTGAKVLRFFIMIFSSLIVIVGLGVIVGALYLYKQSNMNQLVIGLLILGLIIAVCTILGMIAIKDDRPCVILLFQVFIVIVTLFFIVTGMICRFYEGLIDDLGKTLGDSDESIEKIKEALTNLKDPISISFLSITGIGLIDFLFLICYRNKAMKIKEHDKKEFEEGDEVLRSIKGGKNKKERLYDSDSVSLY